MLFEVPTTQVLHTVLYREEVNFMWNIGTEKREY